MIYFAAAPGALYLNMSGVFCCFDPVLIDWLTFMPSATKDDLSGSTNAVYIAVDAEIAHATVPLRSTTSNGK